MRNKDSDVCSNYGAIYIKKTEDIPLFWRLRLREPVVVLRRKYSAATTGYMVCDIDVLRRMSQKCGIEGKRERCELCINLKDSLLMRSVKLLHYTESLLRLVAPHVYSLITSRSL